MNRTRLSFLAGALCAAAFLALPVRLASNGLCVLLFPVHARADGARTAACTCSTGGGADPCPCCEKGSCSCNVSSQEEEDSWLVLILESATPPDGPEDPAAIPSSPFELARSVPAGGIIPPVPAPPPRG